MCHLLFLWPGEARALVTLRTGWGGDGHLWLPVGPLTSTQYLEMGGWGVMPTCGLEGKGFWQWAVGWAAVLSREAQQGSATEPPTPTLQGG